MKKLKLLLTAFALLGGVISVNAQTDVTSTYLTNAGFDACTAETSDVAAKTIKDYSSNGWTNANTGSYTTIAVTAYGGGKKLATSTTPSTKKDGSTVSGNTLGIIAGWADGVKIQSGDITLPAGYYTLTIDHYLSSSTSNYTSSSSQFGFVTAGKSYLVSSTAFTASTWTTETVTFTLTESTTGKIQIGLTGANQSGSATPAVFYDDVTITWTDPDLAAAQTKLSGYIKKATALNGVLSDATLGTAITTAEGVLGSATTSSDCNDASDALSSEISTALSGAIPVSLTNANFDNEVNIAADGSSSTTFIEPATADKPYIYAVNGWTPDFTFSSTAAQGTTAAYGATITGDKGNNGTNPPASDMFTSTAGGALHLSSGWSDRARYKQVIENLPSGRYVFYYEANNQNSGATTINSNYFGVSGTAGDFYGTTNSFVFGDNKTYAYNEWAACAFEFDVAKTANITFNVGVTGTTGGSASGAKLWIDNVLVYRIADVIVTESEANAIIESAEALEDVKFNADDKSDLATKLADFKSAKNIDNYNALNAAIIQANASKDVYATLNTAITYAEAWTATTAAAGLRTKYNNGEYANDVTAADIYAEYRTAEITALTSADAEDWTSVIFDNSFESGGMEFWSAESRDDTGVKNQNNGTYAITSGISVDGSKLFNSWGGTAENNVYQTIKNLPAGTYTLSAVLAGFKDESLVLAANETTNNVVVAGDKTVGYSVSVTFTLADAGDVVIKASNTKSAESSDRSFIKADNFQLYKGNVMTSDYTALNEAITDAEANTLGFDKDEYAPYNNVDALTKLATAKAVNQSNPIAQPILDGIVSDLTGATWTPNDEEVNAVHNGNFATSQNLGWSFSAWGEFVSGLNTNTNASNGTARSSNAGTLTYGNTPGYTMPLKANTGYRLTFKVSSWDNDNKNTGTSVSVLNSSSEGMTTKNFAASGTNRDQNGAFKTYTTLFKTGADGDYTLVITAKGNRSVYTDIELKKATTENIDITSAGYATYVSDVDLNYDGVSGLTAYKASVSGERVILTPVTAVPAGAGVVLKGDAGTYYVPVIASASTLDGNALVRGTGDPVETDAGEGKTNYVLSTDDSDANVGFYWANNETVPANRAYLQTTASSSRLIIVFEDEATGISTVQSAGFMVDGYYDLQGRRVAQPTKGLYIQNGKKVFIK